MLVGSIGSLSLSVGQLCLAVGGVLLWIAAEDAPSASAQPGASGEAFREASGTAALAAWIAASFACAGLVWMVPASALGWAAAIVMAGALGHAVVLGRRCSAPGAAEGACLLVALAVMLGLGCASTARLLPLVVGAARHRTTGETATPTFIVASGLGDLAIDAGMLATVGVAALGCALVGAKAARRVGWAIVTAGIAMAALTVLRAWPLPL
ncbi:MAG: hypothetical protein U0575_12545 [Phycisphaerales bacterium]